MDSPCTATPMDSVQSLERGHDEDLAERLAADLDTFMESRRGTYKPEVDVDKLLEEISQHPLFLDHEPTLEDIEKSPGLRAIQAMKYESEDPRANSLSYKEEGNYYFARKDYRSAVMAYSSGLAVEGLGDDVLKAVLLTNRAAAQYHLGNKRSSIGDCREALKLDGSQLKAMHRCAQCLLDLKLTEEAIHICDRGLSLSESHEGLLKLRTRATDLHKVLERDRRKEAILQNKMDAKCRAVMKAINERKIQLGTRIHFEDPSAPVPALSDDGSTLVWPVTFFYPQVLQCDFIQEFAESSSFAEQLAVIFDQPPPWDTNGCSYNVDNLELYYEDSVDAKAITFKATKTLGAILSHNPRISVHFGHPEFFVLPKDCNIKEDFTTHLLKYKELIARQMREKST